jgi:hypothetical protein
MRRRRRPHRDNIATLAIYLRSGVVIRVPVKRFNADIKPGGVVTSLSWTTTSPSPVILKAVNVDEIVALVEEAL